MLVRKIVSIKNAGRLSNYDAVGDMEFKRFTLIYGENGRGKTTLCAIFRSLQSGDAAHIMGRKTLGVVGVPSVHIQLENSQAQFRDQVWSETLPNLFIFDQDFISENVFSGNSVGTGQRRNLYKIIIGAEGVTIAHQHEQKKDEISALNGRIRSEGAIVQSHLAPGLTLETFLNTPNADGIDEHIATTEREITAASEAALISNHTIFDEPRLFELPNDLTGTLRLTIESVTQQTETLIREHIQAHGMGREGQEWISRGLTYNIEAGCPFCAQEIRQNSLVQAYSNFFSEAYRNLKATITEQGKTFSESSALQIQTIINSITNNQQSLIFWKRYLDLEDLPAINIDTTTATLNTIRENTLRLLRLKVANPIESFEVDEDFTTSNFQLDQFNAVLAEYNLAVRERNVLVQNKKNATQQTNLEALKGNLSRFQALKKRFEEPVVSHCTNLKNLRIEKVQLEQQKDQLKAQLDNYSAATFGNYQRKINEYLEKFNSGFAIGTVDANFVGGANAQYTIVINDHAVRLGDQDTPINEPSFKNTLSSGDKSTLALAFFLAQIDHHPNKDQLIVLFDDPFNSQDSFRRNQTAIEIYRTGAQCKQTIVLSHDANFLKQVKDKIINTPFKTLQIIPIGENNSKIENLDLDRFLQSEMRSIMQRLQNYRSAGIGDPNNIVRDIRPFLEGHCRTICMALFDDSAMLGQILAHIRDNSEDHPLSAIYNELSDLNDYTNRHHHADGSITHVVDQGELLAYVKRALRIVGAH